LFKGDEKMYNNPYMSAYNAQANIDKLNEQINNLEKLKAQMQQPVQQPTNLTQNFQIAPTNREVIRYANSMEEVQRDMVVGDTPYFSKDMSVVWIKNTKGEIKTYELNEIIPKDEKDLKIEYLQAQIEELKKGMKKYERNADVVEPVTDTNESEEPSTVPTVSKSNKKSK
jgi:prefoldin subunit 5